MRRRTFFGRAGRVVAGLATLLLAACGQAGPTEPGKKGGGAAPAPEVNVVTVQPQQVVLTTELAGRTSAYQVAEVRPQVGGILKERLFREGSEVKAGQPLYRIEPSTFEAEVERVQAALVKAEANIATTKLRAERYAELVKINAVSQQAYDDAEVAHKQAVADVAAAKAALQSAKIALGFTTVTAPISGRIGRSSVTQGALVTANQASALATIQRLDPIYVDVTQSSAELLQLRRDLESGALKSAGPDQAGVKLLLEDGTPYARQGKLQFSEVSVDPASGSVTLRAIFPNPRQQLLPGMYVRAVLDAGVRDSALLVPQEAVTRDPKGSASAMIVAADGTVQPRMLKTERTVGRYWLVSEGLAAGDRVIVEGLQKVRPGAAVRPVERPSPTAGGTAGSPAASANATLPGGGRNSPGAPSQTAADSAGKGETKAGASAAGR
ncbi:MAG TPA: efflux RND transporter periplasmic adaptor subunit [Burkholderiaceae bacterium]|nr:efflux RND transporter periplasmic adaptor subunit [Burkholderiaceae bacterium]HQR75276.1 efflux RND transporter periplasmic adaptor subunit [Burkholderiaceae bacterium]